MENMLYIIKNLMGEETDCHIHFYRVMSCIITAGPWDNLKIPDFLFAWNVEKVWDPRY